MLDEDVEESKNAGPAYNPFSGGRDPRPTGGIQATEKFATTVISGGAGGGKKGGRKRKGGGGGGVAGGQELKYTGGFF